jgi:hypothetical protein
MESNKEKIKRYSYWGVFLIVTGYIAGYFLPQESLSYFFTLLKDIITHLIVF